MFVASETSVNTAIKSPEVNHCESWRWAVTYAPGISFMKLLAVKRRKNLIPCMSNDSQNVIKWWWLQKRKKTFIFHHTSAMSFSAFPSPERHSALLLTLLAITKTLEREKKNFFAHLESSPVSGICFRHAKFFLPFDDVPKLSPLKRRRPIRANRAKFCCRRVENYRRHSRRLDDCALLQFAFRNKSSDERMTEWNAKVESKNAKVKHPPLEYVYKPSIRNVYGMSAAQINTSAWNFVIYQSFESNESSEERGGINQSDGSILIQGFVWGAFGVLESTSLGFLMFISGQSSNRSC